MYGCVMPERSRELPATVYTVPAIRVLSQASFPMICCPCVWDVLILTRSTSLEPLDIALQQLSKTWASENIMTFQIFAF